MATVRQHRASWRQVSKHVCVNESQQVAWMDVPTLLVRAGRQQLDLKLYCLRGRTVHHKAVGSFQNLMQRVHQGELVLNLHYAGCAALKAPCQAVHEADVQHVHQHDAAHHVHSDEAVTDGDVNGDVHSDEAACEADTVTDTECTVSVVHECVYDEAAVLVHDEAAAPVHDEAAVPVLRVGDGTKHHAGDGHVLEAEAEACEWTMVKKKWKNKETMSEGNEVKVKDGKMKDAKMADAKVTDAKVTETTVTDAKVMDATVTDPKVREVKVNQVRTTVGNKGHHVQARQRGVRAQAWCESWSEQVVESCLTVAPAMRHHIIGPKGATIARIEAQYRGVRVSVPPSKDLQDHTMRVRGPARQVAAAVSCLEAVLQWEQHVVVSVRVKPHSRAWGATLTTLHAHFPHVRVKVPQRVRARPAGQRGAGRVLHQHPAPGGGG